VDTLLPSSGKVTNHIKKQKPSFKALLRKQEPQLKAMKLRLRRTDKK
jgi:hypothetical protein